MRLSFLLLLLAAVMVAAEPWQRDLRRAEDATLLAHAPAYRIDAVWDGVALRGHLLLDWNNESDQDLPDLAFQTWANGPVFAGARMQVTEAAVDGRTVVPRHLPGDLGVALPLDAPLARGATAAVELRWTLTPSRSGGGHGLLALHAGTILLHPWYPEMAERRNGAWLIEALPNLGDPARARAHHVVCDLRVPDAAQVACGGVILGEEDEPGPLRHLRIAAAGVRNFTVVVGGPWQVEEGDVDGVVVRSWHRPEHVEGGRRALTVACAALRRYATAFGPYPWAELDVVEFPLGHSVGGVESCGAVMIDSEAYQRVLGVGDEWSMNHLGVLMLTMTVAHEVGHQWWQGMVGNDALAEPWLDESLTTWSTIWAMEGLGADAGRAALTTTLAEAMAFRSESGARGSLERGINAYEDESEIGGEVYGRGALAWQELRRRVGDAKMLAALRAWSDDRRFRPASAGDLRRVLTAQLGDEVVNQWWNTWIAGRGLGLRDLMRAMRP